jgi:hypothetical protein
VIKDLVLPLKGTSGRLANDMTGENNAIGSSRIFEMVPHLIGKPILEGGLVNSAIGSYFSYFVQGETSPGCAGAPTLVKPASFDMDRGTKHLALFNVKYFVAKWERTKKYPASSPEWKLLNTAGEWALYELLSHDGRYVSIPEKFPIGVSTTHWERDALEWIYRIDALNQPFIFLQPHEVAAGVPFEVIGADEFSQYLKRIDQSPGVERRAAAETVVTARNVVAKQIPVPGTKMIEREYLDDDGIHFRTRAVGLPHMVKCSYFPNWKVRGADRVYLVSPDFMLVYPCQPDVDIYYGAVASDWVGWGLTSCGLILVAGIVCARVLREDM